MLFASHLAAQGFGACVADTVVHHEKQAMHLACMPRDLCDMQSMGTPLLSCFTCLGQTQCMFTVRASVVHRLPTPEALSLKLQDAAKTAAARHVCICVVLSMAICDCQRVVDPTRSPLVDKLTVAWGLNVYSLLSKACLCSHTALGCLMSLVLCSMLTEGTQVK